MKVGMKSEDAKKHGTNLCLYNQGSLSCFFSKLYIILIIYTLKNKRGLQGRVDILMIISAAESISYIKRIQSFGKQTMCYMRNSGVCLTFFGLKVRTKIRQTEFEQGATRHTSQSVNRK